MTTTVKIQNGSTIPKTLLENTDPSITTNSAMLSLQRHTLIANPGSHLFTITYILLF